MADDSSTISQGEIAGIKLVLNVHTGVLVLVATSMIAGIFYFGDRLNTIQDRLSDRLERLSAQVAAVQSEVSYIKGRVELLPAIKQELEKRAEAAPSPRNSTTPVGNEPSRELLKTFVRLGPYDGKEFSYLASIVGIKFQPLPWSETRLVVPVSELKSPIKNDLLAIQKGMFFSRGSMIKSEIRDKVDIAISAPSAKFDVVAAYLDKRLNYSKTRAYWVETNDPIMKSAFLSFFPERTEPQ